MAIYMQFLANDFVKVYESPDPQSTYAYTPGICVLPGGRLVITMDVGQNVSGSIINDHGYVYISDDHGQTWRQVCSFPFRHARPFTAGKSVYVLGHLNGLRIIRSDDGGETWSEYSQLNERKPFPSLKSACNVWYRGDYLYLVIDDPIVKPDDPRYAVPVWEVNFSTPMLMRANVHDDLLKRESWTFAEELRFCDAVKEKELNYHGIPFLKNWNEVDHWEEGKFVDYPMGWLETNVVQITDPKHYWYDPSGHTFHLFMRAHTSGTGYCCIAKAVEQPDGRITTELIKAPSGRDWVFLPMPGGQMRFHMLYDEQTKLYWLLSTQATDSMTRMELLSAERYNTPCDERQRMQLSFSKNCVDWCFAGIVAAGKTEKQSRHYASMAFDGDDIVIASRSGDENSATAHDTNLITFHRVKNFRSLIY